MIDFLKFVKDKDFLKHKKIGGLTIGEKAIISACFGRGVYLCGDFVSASKMKFALQSLGYSVEIISCGREVVEENDPNLFPFSCAVAKFLDKKIDYLIFLPSSMTTKFNLKKLEEKFVLNKTNSYDLEKVCDTLIKFGYERTDYVNIEGQFALRGDILDIFLFGDDTPCRVEFLTRTLKE